MYVCVVDRQAVGQAARQIVRHLDVDSQRNRYIGIGWKVGCSDITRELQGVIDPGAAHTCI